MPLTYKNALIAVSAAALFTAACAKKHVVAAAPAAPTPTATATEPTRPAPAPARTATNDRTPAATTPRSSYPDADTRAKIDALLRRIEDAYFDYDRASLRPDAMKALQVDATALRDILKDYPGYKLRIEGHADERGSAAYNVALGDRRATTAKDYLVGVGIPAAQFEVVSFGKEKPVCEDHNENCWQKNRRIHIAAASAQ